MLKEEPIFKIEEERSGKSLLETTPTSPTNGIIPIAGTAANRSMKGFIAVLIIFKNDVPKSLTEADNLS